MNLIVQHEKSDCGVACLAMILSHFQSFPNYCEISEEMGCTKDGASIYDICETAQKYGLESEALGGDFNDFYNSVKKCEIALPVIARIVNRSGYTHFVIVKKITQNNVFIYDPDPEVKKIKYPIDFFEQIFQGEIIRFDKSKNFTKIKKSVPPILIYMKDFIKTKHTFASLAIISLMSLISTLIGLSPSLLIKYITENINSSDSEESIELFALIITVCAVMYLTKIFINYFHGKIAVNLSFKLNNQILTKTYNNILLAPLNLVQKKESGDLMNRFRDANKIVDTFTSLFMSLTFDAVMFFTASLILHNRNHAIFVIVMGIIALNIIVSLLYVKPLNLAERQAIYASSRLSCHLKESISGLLTIKSLKAEDEMQTKYEEIFQELKKNSIKTNIKNINKNSLIEIINNIGLLVVFWISAVQIASGLQTIAEFVFSYTILTYILSPVSRLLDTQYQFTEASQAAQRLYELDFINNNSELKLEEKVTDNKDEYFIKLKNINLKYGNKEVLKDLNLNFNHSISCLTGVSGAGKSTIAKLIANLLEPDSGEIIFSQKELRNDVLYVPQHPFLMSGDIKSNLLLGNNNKDTITDATIMEVLMSVGAADFVKTEDDLYTAISEDANNISGGQAQKLCIARSILKKPKILLLDEVTANLDSESKHKVITTINNMKHTTKIWITHDNTVMDFAQTQSIYPISSLCRE